jgi:hypothetical protein
LQRSSISKIAQNSDAILAVLITKACRNLCYIINSPLRIYF